MSEYVRSKSKDKLDYVTCYTCPSVGHWRSFHAGHFWHGKLDYDERNIKPQCVHCNRFKHGNLGIYAARLIKENGEAWFDSLRRDAARVVKLDEIELRRIIKEREDKLKGIL